MPGRERKAREGKISGGTLSLWLEAGRKGKSSRPPRPPLKQALAADPRLRPDQTADPADLGRQLSGKH